MGLLQKAKELGSKAVNIGSLGTISMDDGDPINGFLGSGVGIGGGMNGMKGVPPPVNANDYIAKTPEGIGQLGQITRDQGLMGLDAQKAMTPQISRNESQGQQKDILSQIQSIPQSGGGQNKAMFDALGARAAKNLGVANDSLNRSQQLNSFDSANKRLDLARSTQSADREFELGVKRKQLDAQMGQWAAELQQRSARNAFLGSILGAAGTIGGGIAGGPIGAKIGGTIGGGMAGPTGTPQSPQYSTAINNANNTPTYTQGMRF